MKDKFLDLKNYPSLHNQFFSVILRRLKNDLNSKNRKTKINKKKMQQVAEIKNFATIPSTYANYFQNLLKSSMNES